MKKILAGIILYSPEKNLLDLINALNEQKVDVFLFINKGNSVSDKIIMDKKVAYTSNVFNVGVSDGLNYIIKKFLNSNYDFLFTFDQDSTIDDDYVKVMIDNYKNALKIDKNVVCISPTIIDEKFDNEELIKKNYKSIKIPKLKM